MHKFARDTRGNIRPLTHEKWLYVKAHGFAAIIHTLTDAEAETLMGYMEQAVTRQ